MSDKCLTFEVNKFALRIFVGFSDGDEGLMEHEQEVRQTGGPGLQVGGIIANPRPRPPD